MIYLLAISSVNKPEEPGDEESLEPCAAPGSPIGLTELTEDELAQVFPCVNPDDVPKPSTA